MTKLKILAGAALAAGTMLGTAHAQDSVLVGHLADYTGPTSFVGKQYAPGVADAFKQINADGGIDGTLVELDTVDYAYKVPEAISLYKRWIGNGMVALQGWGTADTEALITFITRDEIPNISGSYSAHLTDPQGKNPNTKLPAPFNFFYGPSYSDACRALVQWASEDAKAKGIDNPTFVHTGDNHPYPNAPKEACAAYAEELGMTVAPPVVVPLAPGDFKAQCLTIKDTGAQYVYMGNLGGSVVSLIKSCNTVGVEATYMGNPWAGDYQTVEAAEAQNLIFPTSTPFYGADVPGMTLVKTILENGGGQVGDRPTHHYLRGVCAAYYMKEAMEWAKANGGITGKGIRDGMYQKSEWVPEGLEGVCLPSTWTPEDHRGLMTVAINSGSMTDGKAEIKEIAEIHLPRRDDWLGQ
ncbi:putative periplasmic substrate-binding protein, ABC-type branched-chain amino acid transporter [Aurantimonas manganoxydans SI85-9A1]|uniref:Putative periplasmic substrate-binding protein, ABC-type branched-chain amino acid transporter n=1 Tax=Aurantimonas manganoxydans (strain ATCC BAA-1229 / DSM 21871 / SI85-9A1) TaxID=287752 RepID=Q1YN08_AURMS|nr:ABC transporter substrate-binding protein [Aurantimonas manganoxydans]EAS51223.1 putative periplasmic substrate-binding protein, ABC-type branched-chain amino acid transporter [Aurantimonas manganoxydans SI85-9A1]